MKNQSLGVVYTIEDVWEAGCTLEPLACLDCGSTEVVFNQYLNDASCQSCGKWQKEDILDVRKLNLGRDKEPHQHY